MKRGRRRALLVFGLLLALLAAYWLWPRDDASSHGTGSAEPLATVADPERATPRTTMQPRTPDDDGVAPPKGDRLRFEYEAYKRASIYPDWSYRLDPQSSALAWNQTVTHDLPLDTSGARFIRFDGSAGRVFPGEPYTSWIEAWKLEGGKRVALPVRVVRAAVAIMSGPAMGDAFELGYHDDGRDGDLQAGDFKMTNRFVPSERDELSRATMARIDAYLEVEGESVQVVRDFVFAPRPVFEVVAIRDRLQDGSLAVTLVADVLESGVYTIYASLFGPDGTPIGLSRPSATLEAGRREVDVVFFGKVLHDVDLDGPYVVKDIHGLLRQQGEEFNIWWQYVGAHTTAPYRAEQFSDAEWDSAEKRERLANFERVIHEQEDIEQ